MKPPRFHFGLPFRAASIWSNLETVGVTDVVGVWQHVAQLMTVVALKQRYAGHAKRAGLIAAANSYMGRLVVVVDDDVDPSNLADVMGRSPRAASRPSRSTSSATPGARLSIRASPTSTSAPASPRTPRRSSEAVRPFGWRDKFPPTRRSPPTKPARSK